MKAMAIFLLAAAAGLVPGSNRAAEPAADPSKAAIERAVLRRFDDMVLEAEALDADELFRHVTENDHGAVVQNGRLWRTRGEALLSVRENFRGLSAVKYQIQERLVTVLSPTAALLVATGTVTVGLPDGRKNSRPFIQTIVFVRQPGGWQVVHSHQSNPSST